MIKNIRTTLVASFYFNYFNRSLFTFYFTYDLDSKIKVNIEETRFRKLIVFSIFFFFGHTRN